MRGCWGSCLFAVGESVAAVAVPVELMPFEAFALASA